MVITRAPRRGSAYLSRACCSTGKGGRQTVIKAVAKNSKKFEIDVDSPKGRRLYTPHNEGGAPLATKEFALVNSKRAA